MSQYYVVFTRFKNEIENYTITTTISHQDELKFTKESIDILTDSIVKNFRMLGYNTITSDEISIISWKKFED